MLLTVEEFKKILRFGEGETIEFKEDLPSPPDLAKQIVAFSNTRGGWILFGVDDRKKIVGVKAWEKEKQLLVNVARNNCQPHIAVKCDFLEVGKRKILVVYVPEGTDKPYQANDKVYVRINSHVHVASGEELRKLIYESGRSFYEKRPMIEYLNTNKRITNREYVALLNGAISGDTALNDLRDMVNKELISIKKKGRSSYYVIR